MVKWSTNALFVYQSYTNLCISVIHWIYHVQGLSYLIILTCNSYVAIESMSNVFNQVLTWGRWKQILKGPLRKAAIIWRWGEGLCFSFHFPLGTFRVEISFVFKWCLIKALPYKVFQLVWLTKIRLNWNFRTPWEICNNGYIPIGTLSRFSSERTACCQ